MFFEILFFLPFLTFLLWPVADPMQPFATDGAPELQRLACRYHQPNDVEQNLRGRVPEINEGTDFFNRRVLECADRVVSVQVRAPQIDAILQHLTPLIDPIVATATERFPGNHLWHIDAIHGDARFVFKLRHAMQTAMQARGFAVSDAIPHLPAEVIRTLPLLPITEAAAKSCAHIVDPLLLVATLDEHETILHAGVCMKSRWTWLM